MATVNDKLTSIQALEVSLHEWMNDETLPTGFKCEIPRATAVMRRLMDRSVHAYDLLCETAENVTYDVRRYGNQSYCWPRLNGLEIATDPWPGVRFPKAVLCVSVLIPRLLQANADREETARAAGFVS